jgi:spore germination protein YaaH
MSMQRITHYVSVLLATAALSGFAPLSAMAATSPSPGPDSARPAVMRQAADQVATAKTGTLQPFTPVAPQAAVGGAGGPLREIFGFALASSLSDPTIGYSTWDFSLLTTVAFFGLHVQDDGTFAADSGWNVWNSSQLTSLLSTAHAHGTKVVVSIILQDFSPGTPHMCAGLMHGTATVNNIAAEVRAKGVDGVNLDYEGLNGSCGTADSSWARHDFTNFTGLLRSTLPAGSYLSVDTYASSAADPLGFFDIPGLNSHVDSFFVMAYDLEYSNWSRAPTSCSRFCLGPTAPLTGYYYNDTSTASQYIAKVAPSKVILGVPYYGRKSCVSSPTANQYPTTAVVADAYTDAMGESTAAMVKPGSYAAHRDANDPAGQERWDVWVNTSLNCIRELYWDDAVSLGAKYALINTDNLRGVGIWTLNYGGGTPELWAALNSYFACPVAVTPPASAGTTEFSVAFSAGSCAVAYFDIEQFDNTSNQGWFALNPVTATNGAGAAVAQGFQGHQYQFRVRAHTKAGVVGQWSSGTTTVSTTATLSHPFKGLYTLDAWGGVHAQASPPLGDSAYWPGWNIVRAAHALPSAGAPQSGAVLDGFGGLHSSGVAITFSASAYWRGWDIARDFAFLPNGTGGFVLDGFGGLHPFSVNGSTSALQALGTPYWAGKDIARKVVIFADGTGGYILDAYGGLHPFGINGPPPASASKVALSGYWAGWDIARDVVLVPGNGNHSGYVLDGYGGLHPFHSSIDGSTMPAAITSQYWRGWNIARGAWLLPGSATAGYTLDGYGGLHPFGGAPAMASSAYWSGRDLARSIWGA